MRVMSLANMKSLLKKSEIPYFLKGSGLYANTGEDIYKKHIVLRDLLAKSSEVPDGYEVIVDGGLKLKKVSNRAIQFALIDEREIGSVVDVAGYSSIIGEKIESLRTQHSEHF